MGIRYWDVSVDLYTIRTNKITAANTIVASYHWLLAQSAFTLDFLMTAPTTRVWTEHIDKSLHLKVIFHAYNWSNCAASWTCDLCADFHFPNAVEAVSMQTFVSTHGSVNSSKHTAHVTSFSRASAKFKYEEKKNFYEHKHVHITCH